LNQDDLARLRADARAEEGKVPATARLAELGQRMLRAKEELDALNAEKKKVQAEYDELRQELIPHAMAEAGIVSA